VHLDEGRRGCSAVATVSGSDCKELSERLSICCVTCNGARGAMAEGVICFITDGIRFSAAMATSARCPLLGLR
jgi:hypothetical protein